MSVPIRKMLAAVAFLILMWDSVGFCRGVPDTKTVQRVNTWKPSKGNFVWEESGKFEGDIALRIFNRNGIRDTEYRWPRGIVPYEINETNFSDDEVMIIKETFQLYHIHTCIRFVEKDDAHVDYLSIQGEYNGCYSFVGRQGGAQTVNLQPNGCIQHGTIIHELMHSLGFFHLQSSAERDDFITIYWDNIDPDQKNNFLKYDEATVTNFNYPYDYGSIMHYSKYAFSKNGKPTLVPKQSTASEIGQRISFSKIDILKLNTMYEKECAKRNVLPPKEIKQSYASPSMEQKHEPRSTDTIVDKTIIIYRSVERRNELPGEGVKKSKPPRSLLDALVGDKSFEAADMSPKRVHIEDPHRLESLGRNPRTRRLMTADPGSNEEPYVLNWRNDTRRTVSRGNAADTNLHVPPSLNNF